MKTTEELFRSVRMYACVSSELWDWKLSPFKMLKSCVCFLAACSGKRCVLFGVTAAFSSSCRRYFLLKVWSALQPSPRLLV